MNAVNSVRGKILNSLVLWSSDRLIVLMAILYAVIPICIFFCGWLKVFYSIPLCVLAGFFVYKLYQNICAVEAKLVNRSTAGYWIVAVCVSAFWVYLSGIGSFAFQNSDHFVRNPIFRDLSEYSWPIIYDLSQETDVVQEITGNGNVAFSYYYTWWLPVSFLAKLFHCSDIGRNLLLYLWALSGILLILYCINRHMGHCSNISLILLIAFSGLDVVGVFFKNGTFTSTAHMEWWAGYFQYSSNTSQLFWVFNQSIPVWLIVGILLQLKENKYAAAISSLVLAYSPWAAFGMAPIAVASTFQKECRLKNFINVINIMMPAAMLLIYGSFYLASSGSEGKFGIIFSLYPGEEKKLLCNFIVFIFLEAGIFFWIMGRKIWSNKYYLVTLLELLLFPLFYYRDRNFVMRGTIPALFLLMVFAIEFLAAQSEYKELKYRKLILTVLLIIGAFTPFTEIKRSLVSTMTNSDILQEQVYSFGNIRTDDQDLISIVKNQFFVYDYEASFFFRHLAK